MICFPNAKINIGLNIIEKRTDGFHNIESIFYPTGFCDVLEIIENRAEEEKIVFTNTGIQIKGKIKDNLCIKAYYLLAEEYNIPSVKIHLHKLIPFESGLGGGSADAAFTLKCLNSIFNLNISNEKLFNYAMRIGSDCGFFIENKPAYVEGRGELLNNIDLNLSKYYLVILNPSIHINTKEAYSKVTPEIPAISLIKYCNTPVTEWNQYIKNDFENYVFVKHPGIKECRDLLYKNGAIYASMTGSGSAVYGIFSKKINISNTKLSRYFIWCGKL